MSLAALLLAGWVTLTPVRAWDAERMQQAAARLGPQAQAAVAPLQALLNNGRNAEDNMRLAAVNQFYNRRIRFATDWQVWGQEDYWTSPLQLLDKGAGDCEDYAIAKYFTLAAMGVPVAKLRLVYVRAQLDPYTVQSHMVLAYYVKADAEPLILDNLMADIRPASQRADLTPVFSFNTEGLWQGVGQTSAGDPVARLSRWGEVVLRAQAEGLM